MESSKLSQKHIPIIVAVAIIILLAVAYYFYFSPKKSEVPPEGIPAELSEQEKIRILEDLGKNSTTTLSISERQKILEDLQKQSKGGDNQISEEEKIQILKDLQRPQNSQ